MSVELIAYAAFFLTMALTYAIMCLGLNVQWGQTGLFNVGIAGFVAIGAYVSALLTTPDAADRFGGFGLPIVVGWLGAMLAAGKILDPAERRFLEHHLQELESRSGVTDKGQNR